MFILNKYYKILGLDSSATVFEIKKAYRKLVKQYHPDVSKYKDAHEKFIEINEAYKYLLSAKTGKQHVSKNHISYDDWIKYKREKARREAAMHAKRKYEEFKKSKIYKSSLIIYDIIRYVYLLIGAAMIVIPFASIDFDNTDPKRLPLLITGAVTLCILGLVFIFMILSTKKSNKI